MIEMSKIITMEMVWDGSEDDLIEFLQSYEETTAPLSISFSFVSKENYRGKNPVRVVKDYSLPVKKIELMK